MDENQSPPVRVRHDDRVAIIELSRPEARNALDDAAKHALIAILSDIAAEGGIGAAVLTGSGKAFCAGGDIGAMAARLAGDHAQVAPESLASQTLTLDLIRRLAQMPKPTIAAVNGAAAGLGCDLALACDLIVAAPEASFILSYLRMGLVPDGGSLYFLPRRVGVARAKELFFSARPVRQPEALAIGLADRGAEAATLVTEAAAWARELAAGSPLATGLGKAMLSASLDLSMDVVFERGRMAQAICHTSAEHRAAVTEFLSRSRPKA